MLSCCHGSVNAKLLHSSLHVLVSRSLCVLVLSGQGEGTQKASWLEQLVQHRPPVVCGAPFLHIQMCAPMYFF